MSRFCSIIEKSVDVIEAGYDEHDPSFEDLGDPVGRNATTVIYSLKLVHSCERISARGTFINRFINKFPSNINGVVNHIALANYLCVANHFECHSGGCISAADICDGE